MPYSHIAGGETGHAAANPPDSPAPPLTSDLVEILLVFMIRLAGLDRAALPWARDGPAPSESYLVSRFRRDPIHIGHRAHAILCATRTSASMPLVLRSVLSVVWWYNMDLASRDGRVDLLDEFVTMHRVHGRPLDFSPTAIDLAAQKGHVRVLQWWLSVSNVPLGASVHALDLASEAGHRHVLDLVSSLAAEGKATIRTVWTDRTQCYQSPSWSQTGQLAFYSPNLRGLKHAIQHSSITILEWWLPVITQEFGGHYPPEVVDWIGGASLQVFHWWRVRDPQFPLAQAFVQAAHHGQLETVRWIMDKTQAQDVLSDIDFHIAFMSAFRGSASVQVVQQLLPRVAPALLESFSLLDVLSPSATSAQLVAWCFDFLPQNTLPECEQLLIFATINGHVDLLDWIAANHDVDGRAFLPMATSDRRIGQVGGTSYRLGNELVNAIKLGHADVLDWWWSYVDRSGTDQELLEKQIGMDRTCLGHWAGLHFLGSIKTAAALSHLPVLDFLVRRYGKREDIRISVALGATTANVLDWWQSNVAEDNFELSNHYPTMIVESAVLGLNVEVLDWWCRKWKGGPLHVSTVYSMDELFTISLADWPMLQWYLAKGYPVFHDVGLPSTLVDEAIATGDWQGLEWWYHERTRLNLPPLDDGSGFAFADRANSVPGLMWCLERLPNQRLDEEAIHRAYLMAWRGMQTGLMWYWMQLAPEICSKNHQVVQQEVGMLERGVTQMWEYPPLRLTVHKGVFTQCPRYPCQCVLNT